MIKRYNNVAMVAGVGDSVGYRVSGGGGGNGDGV